MTIKERLLEIMKELHETTLTKDVTVIIFCEDIDPFKDNVFGYKLEGTEYTGMIFLLTSDSKGINNVINSALRASTRIGNGEQSNNQ